ncbi:MAG: VWA domain-containing protein [Patescibacteria group bacterium]
MRVLFFAPEFLITMTAVMAWIGGIVYEKQLAIYLRTKTQTGNTPTRNRWIRGILGSLCIVFIAVGLSDPRIVESHVDTTKNGIDIALVLDISKSMLAEDITPNRIGAAKQSITRFIEARKNDRIALNIFAGKPFLLSPLSFDTAALVSIVQSIGVDTIKQEIPGFSGTAI